MDPSESHADPKIAVVASAPEHRAAAEALRAEFGFEITDSVRDGSDGHLTFTPQGLGLMERGADKHPLVVDFLHLYRHDRRRRRDDPLLRAVGLHKGPLSVLDATAGWGHDAFRMAVCGARVTAVERSPVMIALLRDGLRRAVVEPEVAAALDGRLQFILADSIQYLNDVPDAERPEAVYIDVMYPHKRRKAALPTREMQALRALVGENPDAPELMAAALRAATRRVTVKRHRYAEFLAPDPSHQLRSPKTRYDIYLK